MTKKHFEALARALKWGHPGLTDHDTPEARIQWAGDVTEIADVCAEFNIGFDKERFLEACTPAGRVFA